MTKEPQGWQPIETAPRDGTIEGQTAATTGHAPEDVETMARLLCEACGERADRVCTSMKRTKDGRQRYPLWESEVYQARANRALDALQAKGWKIASKTTLAENWQDELPTETFWNLPICPREDK